MLMISLSQILQWSMTELQREQTASSHLIGDPVSLKNSTYSQVQDDSVSSKNDFPRQSTH